MADVVQFPIAKRPVPGQQSLAPSGSGVCARPSAADNRQRLLDTDYMNGGVVENVRNQKQRSQDIRELIITYAQELITLDGRVATGTFLGQLEISVEMGEQDTFGDEHAG